MTGNYLPDELAAELVEEARKTAENSYSPYSHFAVGAVVLTKDGQRFPGTNTENASYGLTICAERIALGGAVSAGHMDIRAVAVWTPTESASPCGACRQFIMEFGQDVVVVFQNEKKMIQKTIGELLPYGFTREAMQ